MESKTSLIELGLKTVTFNALRRSGISSIEELEKLDTIALGKIRTIGPIKVEEIMDALDKYRAGDFSKPALDKCARSLYECGNARVGTDGQRILCRLGHNLGRDGMSIPSTQLIRGQPLQLTVCQDCSDFDYMGQPVPAIERGWA